MTKQVTSDKIIKSRSWQGHEEKYSSGRRGAPAKGVGRETGARVQIPPSPLFQINQNFLKKVVDKSEEESYIV